MGVITFTLLFIIVILITITYCGLHLKELDIALYARFNVSLFGKRLDANLSPDELLPLLGQHGISYITEDYFIPGRDVFTCLEMHLKQSRSASVIITPNFLQENWNLYHLNQAVYTEIHQTNFRVIFLLRQSLKSLGPLPENLSLFLRVNTTIKGYEKDWEDQLIYELKHRTKKPVRERLTFGNDSDVTLTMFHSHNPPVSSEVSIQDDSSTEIDNDYIESAPSCQLTYQETEMAC